MSEEPITKRNPRGRPLIYTEQLGQIICGLISNGSNINKIGDMDTMPSRETIYSWFPKHSEFSDNYAKAQKERADHRFDRLENTLEDMRKRKIDAAMARVEMDALKWMCGRENPKKYGDKQEVEHTGTISLVGLVEQSIAPKDVPKGS